MTGGDKPFELLRIIKLSMQVSNKEHIILSRCLPGDLLLCITPIPSSHHPKLGLQRSFQPSQIFAPDSYLNNDGRSRLRRMTV